MRKPKFMVAVVSCLLVALMYVYVINHQTSVEVIAMPQKRTRLESSSIQGHNNLTVSVCIPATIADMKFLPRLLLSINKQTYRPMEVIIVMSNTTHIDCMTIKHGLEQYYNASVLRLYCISKLQFQSISRQNASGFARGNVVSFIDADDAMFPNRIEVIAAIFNKYKPFMVLHGHSGNAAFSWNNKNWKQAKLYNGTELFDIENRTRPHHDGLIAEIMHSQMSVLKEVFRKVQFRTSKAFYRTEDSWFLRDVITSFGRQPSTAYFIDFPLSWYVPRKFPYKWL